MILSSSNRVKTSRLSFVHIMNKANCKQVIHPLLNQYHALKKVRGLGGTKI